MPTIAPAPAEVADLTARRASAQSMATAAEALTDVWGDPAALLQYLRSECPGRPVYAEVIPFVEARIPKAAAPS